jgi:protein-S-isoprenylcysteine O-methyltransferase Ste14
MLDEFCSLGRFSAGAALFYSGRAVLRELPIMLGVALLVVQGMAEFICMRHTGSLRRTWTPEWTFRAVNLPYRLMIVAGVAEHFLTNHAPSVPSMIAGVALALIGIAIRVACHFQLGVRFSPYVELAQEHQLADIGLYRYLRHPMYLGTLLISAGIPLAMGSIWAAGCALLVAIGLLFRMANEERYLRDHLPGYEEYAARTWRLVPGVW